MEILKLEADEKPTDTAPRATCATCPYCPQSDQGGTLRVGDPAPLGGRMRARTLILALTVVAVGYLVVPLVAGAGTDRTGVLETACAKDSDGGATCKGAQPITTADGSALSSREAPIAYDRDDAGTVVLVATTSGDASTVELKVGVRYRVNASGDMCLLPQRYGDTWEPVTTCSLTAANAPNGAMPVNPSQPEEMVWVQQSNTLAPCPTRDAGAADGSFCGGDGGTLRMAGQCVTGACKATFTRIWPQ